MTPANAIQCHFLISHRNVVAGRSSVSYQMARVFLSDNISLFKVFARAERDVITTIHSKWPMKRLYIMYINYMPNLIFGSSFDVYIVRQNRIQNVEDTDETFRFNIKMKMIRAV